MRNGWRSSRNTDYVPNVADKTDETPAESEETYRKDVSDHLMHGTHIAGMIGAAWDRKGVSGIANGIRLLAVRLNENDGRGQGASDVLKGFEWLCRVAEEVNLKAVNVSLGSMQPQLIHTVMANKLGELGVNTVYASGNVAMNLDETIDMGGQNNSPYVIVVNAADMDGKKTQFSCYGLMSTDVFAPGAQILSTVPGIVESRNAEGNLLRIENRRRLFPEAMEIMNPSGTAIERFDQEQTQVRFFDQCPVGQDGQPNPDAEEPELYLFPMQTMSDFLLSPIGSLGATFNEKVAFVVNHEAIRNSAGLTRLGMMFASGPTRPLSEVLANFGYNELCLVMDQLYGLKDLHGITSFDELFTEIGYKDKLLSTDPEVKDGALHDFIRFYLDDQHSGKNLNSFRTIEPKSKDGYGLSAKRTIADNDKYAKARKGTAWDAGVFAAFRQ